MSSPAWFDLPGDVRAALFDLEDAIRENERSAPTAEQTPADFLATVQTMRQARHDLARLILDRIDAPRMSTPGRALCNTGRYAGDWGSA